jgi:hypothetical protein
MVVASPLLNVPLPPRVFGRPNSGTGPRRAVS